MDRHTGYYKGGTDLNDLEVYIGSNNNTSEEWGAQLKTNALSLNAGKTYNYSISLESDKAGAEVLLKNDTDGIELQRKTLTNGKNVFAGTITSEKRKRRAYICTWKSSCRDDFKSNRFY